MSLFTEDIRSYPYAGKTILFSNSGVKRSLRRGGYGLTSSKKACGKTVKRTGGCSKVSWWWIEKLSIGSSL